MIVLRGKLPWPGGCRSCCISARSVGVPHLSDPRPPQNNCYGPAFTKNYLSATTPSLPPIVNVDHTASAKDQQDYRDVSAILAVVSPL